MELDQKDSIVVCHFCRRSVAGDTSKFCGNERLVASLRDNPAALPTEAAYTREEVKGASRALDALDKEIASVSATLESLKERRSSVSTFISEKKSVIAPIRQLPVEILLTIFTMACSKNIFGYWDGSERYTSTINVSQTCSFWRSLCLGRPDLWTKIATVGFTGPSDWTDGKTYLDDTPLFNLYMDRTRERLLDVDMNGAEGSWHHDTSEPDRMMIERLLGTMGRVKSLRINYGLLDEICPEGFDLGDESSIMKLDVHMDSYRPMLSGITHSFLGAPITNISLDGVGVTRLEVQWKSVKTVTLADCTLKDLRALADVANGITFLRLVDMTSKPRRFTGDKVHFPHLTKLMLGNHYEKGNSDVLTLIDCSGLRELEMREGSSHALNAVVEALSSPAGSAHPLRRFSLHCSEADTKILRSILQSFVNIQYLNLDFSPGLCWSRESTFSEDISAFLSPRDDKVYRSSFLPELVALSIRAGRIVIDSRIVGFLESRRRRDVHKHLERFVLSHEAPDLDFYIDVNVDEKGPPCEVICESEALLERLRVLRADGLHICINSDWSPLSDLLCLK